MKEERYLLIGCCILKNEIHYLIEKNKWPIDTFFLNSGLHVDFENLSRSLKFELNKNSGKNLIVFYGECHPLMENMLEEAKTIRTSGQNCIEMLLGNELFTKELSKGAFFLLEDWAYKWTYITKKIYGENKEVMKEIFQVDRKYILCIRTNCSKDFKNEAEEIGKEVGLPVLWMDASLENLEAVLDTVMKQKAAVSYV